MGYQVKTEFIMFYLCESRALHHRRFVLGVMAEFSLAQGRKNRLLAKDF